MNITRRRGMLFAAGLLALAVASVTGIALAQSSNGPSTTAVREVDDARPEATSSVTVPPGQAAAEADEGSGLQGLAKITPDEAKAAALAAVPGSATKVELENEDGRVVYKVEVAGADGRQTDLEIDAGNGAVLSRKTEEAEGTPEAGEAPESAEKESVEPVEPDEQPEANEAGEAPEAPEAPEAAGD
jgi:uncharacterized membrane protein YkoI